MPNSGCDTHSAAHRPFASEVNATENPRPYRHHASSGSPLSVMRMISLVGFGRVVTYPNSGAAFSMFKSDSTADDRRIVGVNGTSLIADLLAVTVSFAKICGMLAGSSEW